MEMRMQRLLCGRPTTWYSFNVIYLYLTICALCIYVPEVISWPDSLWRDLHFLQRNSHLYQFPV